MTFPFPEGDPACGSQHCITCADDGIPMTVRSADQEHGLASCVDEHGSASTVETALVAPVSPGDRLLVHAGTAIAALASADLEQR